MFTDFEMAFDSLASPWASLFCVSKAFLVTWSKQKMLGCFSPIRFVHKQSFLNVLRKQPIFGDATTGFWFPCQMTSEKPAQKFHMMTCHYPDLGSASDWSCHVGILFQPIRSTTQIWVVMRHQYGISAFVI